MKKLKLVIILLIMCVLLMLLFYIATKKENANNTIINNSNEIIYKKDTTNIHEVKGATSYFTVQSCVNKYLNYLAQKDKNSLYKILDSTYIHKFQITQDNVLNSLEDLSGNINFEATKMYYETISDTEKAYYVKGTIEKEEIREDVTNYSIINKNFYITIRLDTDNMIFSVIPSVEGGIFNED